MNTRGTAAKASPEKRRLRDLFGRLTGETGQDATTPIDASAAQHQLLPGETRIVIVSEEEMQRRIDDGVIKDWRPPDLISERPVRIPIPKFNMAPEPLPRPRIGHIPLHSMNDNWYQIRHRKHEELEKRAKRQEKERLTAERNKLRSNLEKLRITVSSMEQSKKAYGAGLIGSKRKLIDENEALLKRYDELLNPGSSLAARQTASSEAERSAASRISSKADGINTRFRHHKAGPSTVKPRKTSKVAANSRRSSKQSLVLIDPEETEEEDLSGSVTRLRIAWRDDNIEATASEEDADVEQSLLPDKSRSPGRQSSLNGQTRRDSSRSAGKRKAITNKQFALVQAALKDLGDLEPSAFEHSFEGLIKSAPPLPRGPDPHIGVPRRRPTTYKRRRDRIKEVLPPIIMGSPQMLEFPVASTSKRQIPHGQSISSNGPLIPDSQESVVIAGGVPPGHYISPTRSDRLTRLSARKDTVARQSTPTLPPTKTTLSQELKIPGSVGEIVSNTTGSSQPRAASAALEDIEMQPDNLDGELRLQRKSARITATAPQLEQAAGDMGTAKSAHAHVRRSPRSSTVSQLDESGNLNDINDPMQIDETIFSAHVEDLPAKSSIGRPARRSSSVSSKPKPPEGSANAQGLPIDSFPSALPTPITSSPPATTYERPSRKKKLPSRFDADDWKLDNHASLRRSIMGGKELTSDLSSLPSSPQAPPRGSQRIQRARTEDATASILVGNASTPSRTRAEGQANQLNGSNDRAGSPPVITGPSSATADAPLLDTNSSRNLRKRHRSLEHLDSATMTETPSSVKRPNKKARIVDLPIEANTVDDSKLPGDSTGPVTGQEEGKRPRRSFSKGLPSYVEHDESDSEMGI